MDSHRTDQNLLRVDLKDAIEQTEELARMVDRVVARAALLQTHVDRYIASGHFKSEDTTEADELMDDVVKLGAKASWWAEMVANHAKLASKRAEAGHAAP